MATRKRHEFLEGDNSDGEQDAGYDSEADDRGRGALTTANKRRKLNLMSDSISDLSDQDDDGFDDDANEQPSQFLSPAHNSQGIRASNSSKNDRTLESFQEQPAPPTISRSSLKSKAVKQAEAAQKSVRKSGVLYVSRVPPFMKPHTLRHFLEPHASKGIGRIFLTPEDHAAHVRRVKNGGNKKKSFTDGWVEFASKTEAKITAETLNGNIVGGKKGNYYHDDLWNIKYLKGFKWQHLTEQIANENAERAARLREEVRKTRKENKAFLEDVERAKMLEGMDKKKKAKEKAEDTSGLERPDPPIAQRRDRRFKQQKVHSESERLERLNSAQSSRVLSKVF